MLARFEIRPGRIKALAYDVSFIWCWSSISVHRNLSPTRAPYFSPLFNNSRNQLRRQHRRVFLIPKLIWLLKFISWNNLKDNWKLYHYFGVLAKAPWLFRWNMWQFWNLFLVPFRFIYCVLLETVLELNALKGTKPAAFQIFGLFKAHFTKLLPSRNLLIKGMCMNFIKPESTSKFRLCAGLTIIYVLAQNLYLFLLF